jgi:hypothetical protein
MKIIGEVTGETGYAGSGAALQSQRFGRHSTAAWTLRRAAV